MARFHGKKRNPNRLLSTTRPRIDFIIGVGGGKLTDLVGYAAHLTNTPFGVVPTLASNCAPWTPLAVMYKENGESEGKSEHFLRQAAFLITDPTLVIDAPVSYFIAGLADTLAKWYESETILAQPQLLFYNWLATQPNYARTRLYLSQNKQSRIWKSKR